MYESGNLSAGLTADMFAGELLGIGVHLECPLPSKEFALQHRQSLTTTMPLTVSVFHHGTGAPVLVPFEGESAPTFTFDLHMPPSPVTTCEVSYAKAV